MKSVLPRHVKIVVVGDSNTGKSSMLITYTTNSFPRNYKPTVYENYSCGLTLGKEVIQLSLYDSAGSDEFDKLRPLCYGKTDVFLLLFSVADRSSFEHAKNKWINELRHRDMGEIPIVLVGSKCDLRQEGNKKSIVSQAEALEFSLKLNCPYIECSALTKEKLDSTFKLAVQVVFKHQKKRFLKYQKSRWNTASSLSQLSPITGSHSEGKASCCVIS
jgi:small GTP-binding protein